MIREFAAEPEADLASLITAEVEPRQRPCARPAAAESDLARPIDKKGPVIAVLNVSRDRGGDQDYLAGGVVEELVANLSRSIWLRAWRWGCPCRRVI